jgi:hypothetical protein
MSREKQMPSINPPVKLEAALHVVMYTTDHYEHPGEYNARWSIYFDAHRSVDYRSRWMLKTKNGADARAKREVVQYLQDLRRQIDEILPRLENALPDAHDMISVPSSAYTEYAPDATSDQEQAS